MSKGTLQTLLIISLAINVACFVFLFKAQKDIRGLNDFYTMRRDQLSNNANEYNEETKLKVEEKVLALKKGIADLGSVKLQAEKEKSYTIINYKDFYKNIYTFIDKKRMLNKDVSERMRSIGNSLYISIDEQGTITNGIPLSLGKSFCNEKQMAFCYTFVDNSLSAPKYDYKIADGLSNKINLNKINYVMDNSTLYPTLRELYAYFNDIKLQSTNSIGKGLY